MAKFKYGERVINLQYGWEVPFLGKGVVKENDSGCPYVLWDGVGIYAQTEDYMVLSEEFLSERESVNCCDGYGNIVKTFKITDPSSEIAHILENAVEREQSNNELQKYTFTYTDANREITHVFKEEMLEYDLEDIVAEFRAFLLGLGFTAEHVGGFIDESKL
jgi:hypothetical protein